MKKILLAIIALAGIRISPTYAMDQSTKSKSKYQIKILTKDDVKKILPGIAKYRICTYRAYPYLYDGTIDSEKDSLDLLANSAHAAVAIAIFQNKIVGLVPGIPLVDYDKKFIGSNDALEEWNINPNQYYYFTDVIVAPQHQGKGLATQMLAHLEQHCKNLGYTTACLACESRKQHPLKPKNYRELDPLWRRLGYIPTPISITLVWKTIFPKELTTVYYHAEHKVIKMIENEPSRDAEHTLLYWIKDLK